MRAPFVLQMAPAADQPGVAVGLHSRPCVQPRVGYTASRKVGGAVDRNRAKRRLRAVARKVMPRLAPAGFDYVLVARTAVLTCPFVQLESDLTAALRELSRKTGGPAADTS